MTESHYFFFVHVPIEHKRASGAQLSMPNSHIYFVHVPNGNVRIAKHASNAIKNSVGEILSRVGNDTRVVDEPLASQVFL